ncbi:isoleucyl-tRNA synthetase [Sarcoptes scabiei]|nr:isoleucyl-tRNA synthetase [Sarcoptes scabiei]
MSSEKENFKQRCRQLEAQDNLGEAFKCALILQRIDPSDQETLDTLRRLNEKIQRFAQEANSTENRMKQMLKYLRDDTIDDDKRIGAGNNLIALVRDEAGQKLFIANKGLELLVLLLKNSKLSFEIHLAMVRVLGQLTDSTIEIASKVFADVGIDFIIEIMSRQKNDEFLIACQHAIQGLLTQFSGYNVKKEKKFDQDRFVKYEPKIDSIMKSLIERINQRMMTAKCRDSLLETLMVNIGFEATNWSQKFVQNDNALERLLDIACELIEVRYESSIPITVDTRTHVSLCLEKIYGSLNCDKLREQFREKTMQYVNSFLKGPDIEKKVQITAAITALLNGPFEVGSYCLSQQGIIEMMLAMANSNDLIQQCVAAEALIAASVKKDKSQSIANQGIGILKALFKSSNPKIKVRALVGLCKLGSVGGTDSSAQILPTESTEELFKACCQLLNTTKKEKEDVKKWAAEGLAYLSLNASIKEMLIEDLDSLKKLIDLGKTGELSSLFGVVTTLVNLTNSYEKQEITPEMKELAKFAKQHVPEEHEFDSKEFVDKRCKILGENNVTTTLVALSKTRAKTSREMICRVFNAICEYQNLRGFVVQQGGVKVLINLALENNSETGRRLAAQAISRIAITNDPNLVFPGQRSIEVVGPIMELLHPDCNALQNFEALMALTNLAQMSVQVRNRILKDGGFSKIENYCYEDHVMLKRSSVQCIANLVLSDQVVKLFEGQNDRVKYFVILTSDDDLDTASAAAGALAMLTSISPKSSQKIFEAKDWRQNLLQLVSSKYPDLQHRGIVIIYNVISANVECARKVIETELLEILMALVRPEMSGINETIKEIAAKCLERAEQLKLIKHIKDLNIKSEQDNDRTV